MEFFTSYTGSDFLVFYGGLLAAAVVAGFWIPTFLREEGRSGVLTDAEELAFLAGGKTRFVDGVLAGLLGRGALSLDGKDKLAIAQTQAGQTPAERAVLGSVGSVKWSDAKRVLDGYEERIEQSLVAKGLMIAPADRLSFRLIPALPYIFILVLGYYRMQAGTELGEPTGFLVALMILTAVLMVIRVAAFNPRTQAGNRALKDAQEQHKRLKSAPTQNEYGQAVGLYGTGVLVGTPLFAYHSMRQSSGGDSGSGGDSDGGDGGCGGGCGGCGG
ncbi:TIGR04222 domain-containing membrane protein [Erythrobacter sp. W53]|uniref:TIGR04222 domain-containing membrane protein n=1 Tax=Erythrobacter sp. W53 TaxID=3425947 RepID=UPI003D769AD2